jgi:hypothetical protein
MESNPHRFEPSTDNPHRHHRKEEAIPYLHTGDKLIHQVKLIDMSLFASYSKHAKVPKQY